METQNKCKCLYGAYNVSGTFWSVLQVLSVLIFTITKQESFYYFYTQNTGSSIRGRAGILI